MNEKFCNILLRPSLRRIYHVTEAVEAVVGSIVVVGALTRCVLFHLVCDFKVTRMNVERNQIRALLLHEFELGHNAPWNN